jgi:hypothetical protein
VPRAHSSSPRGSRAVARDRDEELVRGLVEKLGSDVAVFFAPERQRERELVGTDGVASFASVYKSQSRTVAIAYREDWGSTTGTWQDNRMIVPR